MKHLVLPVLMVATVLSCGGGSSTEPELQITYLEPSVERYKCHESGANPCGLPECPDVCWTGEGGNSKDAPLCPPCPY